MFMILRNLAPTAPADYFYIWCVPRESSVSLSVVLPSVTSCLICSSATSGGDVPHGTVRDMGVGGVV